MLGLPAHFARLFSRDQGKVQRRLLRLWSLVRPPWAPPQGTRLEFELEPPTFRIFHQGELAYQALPVPVASWDPDSLRLSWSLTDETIPSESVEWLAQLLNPETRALFQTGLSQVQAREARELASWAAGQLGYLAAYPAPWVEGRTLYVAVKPRSTRPEDPLELACLFCLAGEGWAEDLIEFEGTEGTGICAPCVHGFLDRLEQCPPVPEEFPCVACGRRRPRLLHQHPGDPSALCLECLELVAEALVEES